jgi:hypothetical protein
MRIYELFENANTLYFHATASEFEDFSHRHTGSIGFYFTEDYNEALRYKTSARSPTARIIAAHLDLGKVAPFDAVSIALQKSSGGNPRKQIREMLQSQGYDSIVRGTKETIVFEPEQIHIVDHNYQPDK